MGLFRVRGWFVNHDFRYSGRVECAVEREDAPTEDDAERLLWASADAQMERRFPGESGGLWHNEFTTVTVDDQPRLGVSGVLGGHVARRLAHLAAAMVDRDADVLFTTGDDEFDCGRRLAEARDAGVGHLVYLATGGAAGDAEEQEVRRSGMDFTVLRANVCVEELVTLADSSGVIRGPAGDGRFAAVAQCDVVDVAAAVLGAPGRHVGRKYTLTGPEPLVMSEFAERAAAALGRPLSFEDGPAEAPELSTFLAIAHGSFAAVTGDIEAVCGWRARTVEEALRQ